jgi:2-oxoglutarate dehydrogenase E1 component
MSPKSLLRHKSATSQLEQLSSGTFKTVIDDTLDNQTITQITRIILCSGKVYYDLTDKKQQQHLKHIALIRIEQLYPFPQSELELIFQRYTQAKDIIWCQEEPRNQGAWYTIRHNLETVLSNNVLKNTHLQENQQLNYVGRKASAAPAVGLLRIHIAQQIKLVNQALGLESFTT